MKDILFAGHRILTSDEIADAVIQYAAALIAAAGADVVTFPAFDDGEPAEFSLVIGCGAQIAAVTVPEAYPVTLVGGDEACIAIDTQYAALRQGEAG